MLKIGWLGEWIMGIALLGGAIAPLVGEEHKPPAVSREFRGAWVASVENIDWPSKRGLPVETQRQEMLALLDKAVALNLNAIILQVRPCCDALYASEHEPWSEYLNGKMGQSPEPFYDPLEFAVQEAHKRGLELHAWFNPYRARHAEAKSEISSGHIRKRHPALVKQYGRSLWLDPGEKEVQEHSRNVILDVVKRYNIDGVHLDDYFYPYKERDASGQIIDFPDEPSWKKYLASGGTLSRDDWRRENVNGFIEQLYKDIKKTKVWVKFGISPFGIYRPGSPPSAKGFDQYTELYADALKWFKNGWMDYFTPQLYWKIGQTGQSYPALLEWWAAQNKKGRHLWVGNFTSRVADGSKTAWTAEEVLHQVQITRKQEGATGNVHFSMKALLKNYGGVADKLKAGEYAAPALVPASPWLEKTPPSQPSVYLRSEEEADEQTLHWEPEGKEKVWLWVVQTCVGQKWQTHILPSSTTHLTLKSTESIEQVAVSAVDRCGNQGASAMLDISASRK